ncbi:MAG: hypothetical protein IIB07_10460 [Bacteroidetes bacterium]|nr:hypothetical protein [Bacteroidota bacterium]
MTKFSSPEEEKVISQKMWDEFIGIENKSRINRKYSTKELFASNSLFKPFSEIIKSYQSLENIKIYIGSFPYKNKKIKKDEYLRYHLENYLNELYILKNRLIAFVRILSKAYSKSLLKDKVNKHFPKLCVSVSDSFKGYTNIRGLHVHQNRYTTFDLDRLASFEIFMLSDDEKMELIRNYYKEVYREIRNNWRKNISEDLKSIKNLLDYYFGEIMEVIVENDKIIYPNKKWV